MGKPLVVAITKVAAKKKPAKKAAKKKKAKKAKKTKKKKKKKKAKKPKKKRKKKKATAAGKKSVLRMKAKGIGLFAPKALSADLAAICEKNKLNKGRIIHPDAKLKKVLPANSLSMFKMPG